MFRGRVQGKTESFDLFTAVNRAMEDDVPDLDDADTVELADRVHELFQDRRDPQAQPQAGPGLGRQVMAQNGSRQRANAVRVVRSVSMERLPRLRTDPVEAELRRRTQLQEAEVRLMEPMRSILQDLAKQGVLTSARDIHIESHQTVNKVTTYELVVDGVRIQYIDAEDPHAYNMMSVHRFIEGLQSKRDCIRDLVKNRDADSQVIDDLETMYADAVGKLREIKLKIKDVGSKKWVERVEKAIEEATKITGQYIVDSCLRLQDVSGLKDFKPPLLQACENQRNGRQLRTVVTVYSPHEGLRMVETATPITDKQNVSGWRMEPTLCNAFKRRALIQTDSGLKLLAQADTHSSLAPIGVGKVEQQDAVYVATGTRRRLACGVQAFRDLLAASVRQRVDLSTVEDYERIKLPLSWATLFTPIKEALDLRFRGMEAESLMLWESYFIYQLCDGQDFHLNVDGKPLVVVPETQLINIGCNFHATSSSKLAYLARNAELEDAINQLGMEKLTMQCEELIGESTDTKIRGLQEARASVRKRLEKMEAKLNEERKFLLAVLTEGSSGIEGVEQFEGLYANFRQQIAKRDEEVAIAHGYTKAIYRGSVNTRLQDLAGKRERLAQLRQDGPPSGLGAARAQKAWKEKIERLELEADVLQLYLEVQELLYGQDDRGPPLGRDKDHVYQIQACVVRLGELLDRLAGFNCKSAEDRSGAKWVWYVIFCLVKELTGVHPPLSSLLAKNKAYLAASEMMQKKELHRASFEFGISSAINCLNNPGTPGMQVGGKVNPMQGERAKVGKMGGEFAKGPYKVAKELWKKC